MAPSSGVCSSTRTRKPFRPSASAVERPPMPPPATRIGRSLRATVPPAEIIMGWATRLSGEVHLFHRPRIATLKHVSGEASMTAKAEDVIKRARPFTGPEYLESLRDGREIWIYGERVDDVTTHPAFRNAAR